LSTSEIPSPRACNRGDDPLAAVCGPILPARGDGDTLNNDDVADVTAAAAADDDDDDDVDVIVAFSPADPVFVVDVAGNSEEQRTSTEAE